MSLVTVLTKLKPNVTGSEPIDLIDINVVMAIMTVVLTCISDSKNQKIFELCH